MIDAPPGENKRAVSHLLAVVSKGKRNTIMRGSLSKKDAHDHAVVHFIFAASTTTPIRYYDTRSRKKQPQTSKIHTIGYLDKILLDFVPNLLFPYKKD